MRKYRLEMLPDTPEVQDMKERYRGIEDERKDPKYGNFKLPSRDLVPFVKKEDKLFRRVWDDKLRGERLVEIDPTRISDWEKRAKFVDLDALNDIYATYGHNTPTNKAQQSKLVDDALVAASVGTGTKLAAYGILGTSNPATLPTAMFAIPTLLGEIVKKAQIPEGHRLRDLVVVDPTNRQDIQESAQGYLDRSAFRDSYQEAPPGVTEKEYSEMFAKEMRSQGKEYDPENRRWIPKGATAFQLCLSHGKKQIKKKSFKEAIVFEQAGLHPNQEATYQGKRSAPKKPDNRIGQALKRPVTGGGFSATPPEVFRDAVGGSIQAIGRSPVSVTDAAGDLIGIKKASNYSPATWILRGIKSAAEAADDWSIDVSGY